MSCHYYKRRLPPPGICSWTKIRLGWLAPSKIKVVLPGETVELILGPLEDGSSDILAIKIPVSRTTYYLIENRQPIGFFDRYLPASGVLIMYADDSVSQCRFGKSPVRLVNADPSIPRLEGAALDITKRKSFIDAKRGIKVKLLEKIESSYRILISYVK